MLNSNHDASGLAQDDKDALIALYPGESDGTGGGDDSAGGGGGGGDTCIASGSTPPTSCSDCCTKACFTKGKKSGKCKRMNNLTVRFIPLNILICYFTLNAPVGVQSSVFVYSSRSLGMILSAHAVSHLGLVCRTGHLHAELSTLYAVLNNPVAESQQLSYTWV